MMSKGMVAKMNKRVRGEGRVFRRGKVCWVQYYAHGLQVRESAHTEDEKKASKILRKRLGAIAAGIQQDTRGLRYEDLRDSYYDDYRTNRRRSLRYGKDGSPRLDKV